MAHRFDPLNPGTPLPEPTANELLGIEEPIGPLTSRRTSESGVTVFDEEQRQRDEAALRGFDPGQTGIQSATDLLRQPFQLQLQDVAEQIKNTFRETGGGRSSFANNALIRALSRQGAAFSGQVARTGTNLSAQRLAALRGTLSESGRLRPFSRSSGESFAPDPDDVFAQLGISSGGAPGFNSGATGFNPISNPNAGLRQTNQIFQSPIAFGTPTPTTVRQPFFDPTQFRAPPLPTQPGQNFTPEQGGPDFGEFV